MSHHNQGEHFSYSGKAKGGASQRRGRDEQGAASHRWKPSNETQGTRDRSLQWVSPQSVVKWDLLWKQFQRTRLRLAATTNGDSTEQLQVNTSVYSLSGSGMFICQDGWSRCHRRGTDTAKTNGLTVQTPESEVEVWAGSLSSRPLSWVRTVVFLVSSRGHPAVPTLPRCLFLEGPIFSSDKDTSQTGSGHPKNINPP